MKNLSYIIIEEKLCITAYHGSEIQLQIPDVIDGYPVCIIAKKAFWGNRRLQRIVLPETIEKIEDWAFAGCSALREIVFPQNDFLMGNKIFWKCSELQYVYLGKMKQSLARLLACGINEMGTEHLLDYQQVGSEKWYQRLDTKLLQVLQEPEETVLRDLVYCAEEDMLDKQEECLYRQRLQKAGLAFLRLVYAQGLAPDVYGQLKEYIVHRTKGCSTEEAWDIVMGKSPEQFLYCDKLLEIGGIHSENIDDILSDLDDSQIELKAYILKIWQKEAETKTIWETLSLDNIGAGEIL